MRALLLLCLTGTCLIAACAASAKKYDPEFAMAPEPVVEDWQLVKDKCLPCHGMDRYFNHLELYSERRDIEEVVRDMARKRGAKISDDEQVRIVNALDWHREQQE